MYESSEDKGNIRNDTNQVEFFAQGSEIALLCKRRKGVGQLSWEERKNTMISFVE